MSMKPDDVVRQVPDFLVIGAMKAGTTALAEVMNCHPEIYIPQSKEPTYFIDRDEEFIFGDRRKGKYSYGPRTQQAYEDLFKGVPSYVLKGEASTQYLANPTSPKLVYDANPNTKLIVLLREPVDRAYSAYSYNKTIQREKTSTFSKALSEELSGERDSYYFAFRYLHYGLYAQHLAHWKEFFPAKQIKVMLFDDFKNNPTDFYADIAEFLGVREFVIIDNPSLDNSTVRPKNIFQKSIWWLMEAPHPLKLLAKKYLNNNLLASLKKVFKSHLIKIGLTPPKITEKDINMIGNYFTEDSIQLKDEFEVSFYE
jgi:hypothetical protein